MTPLNVILLPYVPYALLKVPSPNVNSYMTTFQYMVFIIVIYIIFFFGSCLLLPFAFLKALANKSLKFSKATTLKEKGMALANILVFIVAGFPFLILGMGTDLFYFWKNNFRTNLKKIIIEKINSSITNETTRTIKA